MLKLVEVIRRLPPRGIWADISIISSTAAVSLVAGVVLVFYFALYRDRGTLHASVRLRLLCRAAAFLLGIILMIDLPTRWSALAVDRANAVGVEWRSGAAAIWTVAHDPSIKSIANNLLDLLAGVPSIALLALLSRGSDGISSQAAPVGRLLREVSAVTVVFLGLVLMAQVVGLAAAPFTYSLVRDQSYRFGLTPPGPIDFVLPLIRGLALGACGFLVPFLVYMSSSKANEGGENIHPS